MIPRKNLAWDHYRIRQNSASKATKNLIFADGFLFLVKELEFWTNLGHWVRVLDVVGFYMYIVL